MIQSLGKRKIRWPNRHGSGTVERSYVWRRGRLYFMSYGAACGLVKCCELRRLDPPEDYQRRRSEGLIEFEVII